MVIAQRRAAEARGRRQPVVVLGERRGPGRPA
jgi:hypothetical protein